MTIVAVVATVIACVTSGPCGGTATAATVSATLTKIAVGTAVGTAVSLAVGGTIAGLQSAITGHGFWNGLGESVQTNALDALITSFAFASVTVALSNAITHFQCFKEGTLVETENGLKPIEEIEVGDKVLAYDEDTGEQGYKTVKQLFRNESNNWVKVTVNGADIESTPGHKYFLPKTKKWVSAEDLKVGTKVLLSDGNYGIVETIEHISYDTPQTTYNFEVEDYHTYYVGTQGVCVHNQNCGVGGHGWEGDADWRANVKTVREGGDIMELKGGIPTQAQAEKLVIQSKGTLIRAEGAHLPPNPHTFPHINYLTYSGNKGMIRLDYVVPKIY